MSSLQEIFSNTVFTQENAFKTPTVVVDGLKIYIILNNVKSFYISSQNSSVHFFSLFIFTLNIHSVTRGIKKKCIKIYTKNIKKAGFYIFL